jgi:phosphate transport system protein
MSLLEKRLANDLQDIQSGILRLGQAVHKALGNASLALLTGNSELSYQTILGDHPVNREVDALNLKCHRFIAKHLPSAGHLRFISSSLRIIILIERLGDYAVTISREAVQLETPVQGDFRDDLEKMSTDALAMLQQSLTAYERQDVELAQETAAMAKGVDRDYLLAYSDLVDAGGANMSRSDQFARLVIIRQIERVSDQAKNLCEEVVFAGTGETKQRRRYRLLFVDGKDDGATHIAVAVCRKYHSDRIQADSLGATPAPTIRDEIRGLCEDKGLDLSGLDPSGLYEDPALWRGHDVLVTINSDISEYVDQVPYGIVPVRWDVPTDGSVESLFQVITGHVDDLVHLVRGPATS